MDVLCPHLLPLTSSCVFPWSPLHMHWNKYAYPYNELFQLSSSMKRNQDKKKLIAFCLGSEFKHQSVWWAPEQGQSRARRQVTKDGSRGQAEEGKKQGQPFSDSYWTSLACISFPYSIRNGCSHFVYAHSISGCGAYTCNVIALANMK